MTVLKAVVIGYGGMGKLWSQILSDRRRISLVGVVDVLQASTDQAQAAFHLAKTAVGNDLRTVLIATKPDFIVDCSAPSSHASNTTTALDFGCHVLGEKPIALDIAEAERIVTLSESVHKIYMVNQNYRWRPIMLALKRYLAKGLLGRIRSINVVYAQNFAFNDTFRKNMSSPLLMDMAVHHFDLVRSITGANHRSVYCIESGKLQENLLGASSASAIFLLDDDTVFTYQGSWGEVGNSTSFMGTWRIACEKGTIIWDGRGSPKVVFVEHAKTGTHSIDLPTDLMTKSVDAFRHELEISLDVFLHAIASGVQPETSCEDNVHTLAMVLDAICSSETKNIVRGKG